MTLGDTGGLNINGDTAGGSGEEPKEENDDEETERLGASAADIT